MRASIIIPVHNAGAYLPKTLRSWLDQTLEGDYEVIAVDNNSTDNSLELLRAENDPRLKVLQEPEQGAYAARNRGASQATGEVLVFTDPDCLARGEWLSELLGALEQEHVELVCGRDRPAGASRAIRVLGAYDHHKEIWTFSHKDPAVYYGHTNNLAVTRRAWDIAGPFDQRKRGADVIFVQRLLERLGVASAVYHPQAQVEHLEVHRAKVYFRKCRLYGRSGRLYGQVVSTRALSFAERWRIYRQTVRDEPLSSQDAAYLLSLLVAGVGFFVWGSRMDRIDIERQGDAKPAA